MLIIERENARRADGETAIAKLQDEQNQLTTTSGNIAEQMPAAIEALTSATLKSKL